MRSDDEHLANIILVGLVLLALVLGAMCAANGDRMEDRWRAGIGRGRPAGDGPAAGARLRGDGRIMALALPAVAWRPRVPAAGLAAIGLRYDAVAIGAVAGHNDISASWGVPPRNGELVRTIPRWRRVGLPSLGVPPKGGGCPPGPKGVGDAQRAATGDCVLDIRDIRDEYDHADLIAGVRPQPDGRGNGWPPDPRDAGDAVPDVRGCPPGGGPPRCRRVVPALPPPPPACRDLAGVREQSKCVWFDNGLGWLWPTMERIAECESGFDAYAIGPTNDYGVFQIHRPTWDWLWPIYGPWYDPVSNSAAAVRVYRIQGLAAWSCWR